MSQTYRRSAIRAITAKLKATPGATSKTCFDCWQDLPLDKFHDTPKGILGKQSYCKACQALRNKLCDSTQKTRTRASNFSIRMEGLRAYGGERPECVCCGTADPLFLCLDHVHNNGKQHRLELLGEGERGSMYRALANIGWPNDSPYEIQILCANCNSAKQWWGSCPHGWADAERLAFMEARRSATLFDVSVSYDASTDSASPNHLHIVTYQLNEDGGTLEVPIPPPPGVKT